VSRKLIKRLSLIARYEHNHFRGWIVTAKRRGKRFRRYFSDRPNGKKAALHAARVFRDKLVTRLPPPIKIKRKYVRNTTGVIGVSRIKECTRSGRPFVRYVAQWPGRGGKNGRATFSVDSYGESQAFRLAVAARRAGLRELKRHEKRKGFLSRQTDRLRFALSHG
jgi:AP2 domain